MSDDPIRAYLADLGRHLGRFSPRRRRVLGEVEDHLREAAARIEATGASPHQAAVRAVDQFGSPPLVASTFSGSWRRKWQVGAVAVALLVVAVVAELAAPSASHATIPMTASNALVPQAMRHQPTGEGSQPGMPIPAGTRIDAYAPLSTDATYVLTTYIWRGWHCDSDYLAAPGSLTPTTPPAGSICRPPASPRPAVDLQIAGGSGQAFVLSGTAPIRADQLAITTTNGDTHTFSLPRISLHTDPHRQAIILDLTTAHISSVVRLTLLANGHTLASLRLGSA